MEMIMMAPPGTHPAQPITVALLLVSKFAQGLLDGGMHENAPDFWIGRGPSDQPGTRIRPFFGINRQPAFGQHGYGSAGFAALVALHIGGHGGSARYRHQDQSGASDGPTTWARHAAAPYLPPTGPASRHALWLQSPAFQQNQPVSAVPQLRLRDRRMACQAGPVLANCLPPAIQPLV